jgi:hypothetical protein
LRGLAAIILIGMAIVGAVLYVGGYLLPDNAFYPVTLNQARLRLKALKLPAILYGPDFGSFAFRETRPNHFEADLVDGDVVHSRYLVDIAVEEGGIRVTLNYVGVSPDAIRRMEYQPATRHLFYTAMREDIAAALTGEPYNTLPVYVSGAIAYVVTLAPLADDLRATPTFKDPAVPLR